MIEIKNRAHLSDQDFDLWQSALQHHRSLQDVLRWAREQPEGALIPGVIAQLVVQDEFSHDLVVPWRGLFIVYGTT